MSEIEQKALALLNECGWGGAHMKRTWNPRYEALCRAVEQHEQFKREVSDAVSGFWNYCRTTDTPFPSDLDRFILPKPVDPLVESICVTFGADIMGPGDDDKFREALAKRGGRIVWENEP